MAVTRESITLRDRSDRRRQFRLATGAFLFEGVPVTLRAPAARSATRASPVRTASGSRAAVRTAARVAAPSRIWVEGRHDAELVEHVWGDDLRELAVVVEPMHGADGLDEAVRAFGPRPGRRLGVLLDHLVAGSKESRSRPPSRGPHVLVVGHPFVDVWAGVRPDVAGIEVWPDVPPGVPWKDGVCAALGVPLDGFWPRLRNRVRTFADLRPELVGAVERLIDFVAEPMAPASDH